MSRFVSKKTKTPLWLMSYADMATLILCFMVLLTSLSVIDERLKLDVLGSVNKNYASSLAIPLPDNPDAFELAKLQEGLGEKRIYGRDFDLLKRQVLSEELGDMTFQENSHIQIISLSETALFEPGTTFLSEKGESILDRIMPLLVGIEYPLLVAGHASSRMDEEGPTYNIADDAEEPSWKIGFERAYAVLAYLVEAGVPKDKVRLESFGEYRPRGSMRTPLGRDSNRRVDLVLDKRNVGVAESIKKTSPEKKQETNTHEIDGFHFDLTLPGEETEADQTDQGLSLHHAPAPDRAGGSWGYGGRADGGWGYGGWIDGGWGYGAGGYGDWVDGNWIASFLAFNGMGFIPSTEYKKANSDTQASHWEHNRSIDTIQVKARIFVPIFASTATPICVPDFAVTSRSTCTLAFDPTLGDAHA